jgi:hypothetical protein
LLWEKHNAKQIYVYKISKELITVGTTIYFTIVISLLHVSAESRHFAVTVTSSSVIVYLCPKHNEMFQSQIILQKGQ